MLVDAGIPPVCGAALPGGPVTEDSRCKQAGLLTFQNTDGSDLHLDHEPPLQPRERHDPAAVMNPMRLQLLCKRDHSAKTSREIHSVVRGASAWLLSSLLAVASVPVLGESYSHGHALCAACNCSTIGWSTSSIGNSDVHSIGNEAVVIRHFVHRVETEIPSRISIRRFAVSNTDVGTFGTLQTVGAGLSGSRGGGAGSNLRIESPQRAERGDNCGEGDADHGPISYRTPVPWLLFPSIALAGISAWWSADPRRSGLAGCAIGGASVLLFVLAWLG
jgi:hypothetical protein